MLGLPLYTYHIAKSKTEEVGWVAVSNWPLDKTLGIVDSSGRKVYLIDTTKVQRAVSSFPFPDQI